VRAAPGRNGWQGLPALPSAEFIDPQMTRCAEHGAWNSTQRFNSRTAFWSALAAASAFQ